MSGRFAPLTSDLFVRKGEAVPSMAAPKPAMFWTRTPPRSEIVSPPPPPPPSEPAVAFAAPRADAFEPPPPPPPMEVKPHRMMVTLSAVEYEKLGIAAVKKGLTRHQIVRTALDTHLDKLKREYGGCGCMAMGEGSCAKGCGT